MTIYFDMGSSDTSKWRITTFTVTDTTRTIDNENFQNFTVRTEDAGYIGCQSSRDFRITNIGEPLYISADEVEVKAPGVGISPYGDLYVDVWMGKYDPEIH